MNPKTITSLLLATTILGGVLPQVACAALPMLGQPWLGRFAVATSREFRFYISSDGTMQLEPLGKNGQPIGLFHNFPILVVVEATTQDGVLVWLTVDPASLESADPATDKLRKITLRGKAVGGTPAAAVSFEATIERDGGSILIGGRVTDPGVFKTPPRSACGMRPPRL